MNILVGTKDFTIRFLHDLVQNYKIQVGCKPRIVMSVYVVGAKISIEPQLCHKTQGSEPIGPKYWQNTGDETNQT